MRHRLVALALALGAALTLSPGHAQAAWTVTAAGPAVQTALTVPAGTQPVLSGYAGMPVVGRSITVSWPTAPLSDGRPVTGYLVSRTGGGALVNGGSCWGTGGIVLAQTIRIQSCSDLVGLSLGTFTYTVTPVYGSWRGAPSAPSSATL